MNYADLAIIAILVLAVIWGLIRGFWRSFSKAVTLIGALALAFILAGQLTPSIFNADVEALINNNIVTKFVVDNSTSAGYVIGVGENWGVLTEGSVVPMELDAALLAMYVPTFLHAPILSSLGGLAVEDIVAGVTLRTVVCSAYTHLISLFLTGVIIFLASLIVLRIIAKLIYNALKYRHYLSGVDRLFGGIMRIVTGSLLVIIILHVISIFSGIEALQPVIDEIMAGQISGPLYDAGLLNKLFYGDGMKNVVELFKNIILPAKEATDAAAIAFSALV